jgi:hypothetical protein
MKEILSDGREIFVGRVTDHLLLDSSFSRCLLFSSAHALREFFENGRLNRST